MERFLQLQYRMGRIGYDHLQALLARLRNSDGAGAYTDRGGN